MSEAAWSSGDRWRRTAPTAAVLAVLALCAGAGAPAALGADTCPNAQFRTGLSADLPDCRAYELVTPLDKNGGDALGGGSVFDGDHVYFNAGAAFFADDPWLANVAYYLATRTETGWSLLAGWRGTSTPIEDASADYSQQIVQGLAPLLPSDNDLSTDVYRRASGGELTLVSVGSLGGNAPDTPALYAGQSVDGSHILFETAEKLEPEDDGRVAGVQLYERIGDEVRVVGLDDDEKLVDTGGAVLGDGASPSFRASGSSNAISRDGARIFFASPDPGTFGNTQLYLRENGEDTTHVSASQCDRAAPDPPCSDPAPVTFQGAAADGSSVLFTTTAQLVDGDLDSSVDLYRYDVGGSQLVRVSGGPDGMGQDASVLGVVAESDDGRRTYFLAAGEVAPGGKAGSSNIYLYDNQNQTTTFVADAGSAGVLNLGLSTPSFAASSTSDGSALVFESTVKLTSFDNAGAGEVYRYHAPTNELACVSCNSTGSPPLTDALGASAQIRNARGPNGPLFQPSSASAGTRVSEVVSEDGSMVAFQSIDALIPQDTNARYDVYLWHNGNLSLLTSGTSANDSKVIGIGPDGRDVFFTTYDQLLPQDTDFQADVYDARIGGGLPEPPAPPKPCVAEQCQPPPTGRPILPTPGSLEFHGAGDEKPGVRPRLRVVRVSRAQRSRFARTGRLRLKVRVSHAGKVSVLGRANVNGRHRRVARVSKRARKAGTVKLTVRLSKAARHQLARRGRLKVALSLRMVGADETSMLKLTLRRVAVLAPGKGGEAR